MARCCTGPSIIEAMDRAEAAATEAQEYAESMAVTKHLVSEYYYGYQANYTPTTHTAALNIQLAMPIPIPEEATFDRISCEVTTLGAGSTVRMGIYASAADGFPGALVQDAGTIATTSTGVKEITINETLVPGLYWLSLAAQGGTPPVLRSIGNIALPPVVDNSFIGAGATVGSSSYQRSAISGAFSDWPPLPASVGANAPIVKLRAA